MNGFRISFWLGALIGMVSLASSAVAGAPKPNIVHIMIDDLGWQDIASHKMDGQPVYETPNLDRLTRQGRRFTQAYSPSPTCAPSRTSFLSGRHPAHTGIYHVTGSSLPRVRDQFALVPPYYPYGLPPDATTIPQVLKRAGYVSGHVGKWHVGGKSEGYPFPLDLGFDFGFSDRSYNDPELWNPEEGDKLQFFGSWRRMKNRAKDFATADPSDPFQIDADGRPFDKPLDLAVGFMRQNKEKPFFLSFCTFYVHGPIGTRDRVRLEKYCKKMGYDFPTDPGIINSSKWSGHHNPYYASNVDTVDWMVGNVLEYLETTDDPRNPGHKLIDNTYVIVDADNGGCIHIRSSEPVTDNSPLQEGKVTTYEGGIRIPFLVRGPDVEPGSTCDTPINLLDMFPTFMAMAGMEPDPSLELDGCNILPLMKDEADAAVHANGTPREAMHWYFPIESCMTAVIRKGGWKLTHHYGMERGDSRPAGLELYRLYNDDGSAADLGERENLADKHPEIRKSLAAELIDFLNDSGVSEPYRNPAFATDAERVALPSIVKRGSEGSRVWVEFESGEGKSAITEAFLLYTLNPKPFDTTRGHRQEWFRLPVTPVDGRVETTMPPGATHGVFYLRDANDLIITSREKDFGVKGNYAYTPGLHALIQLGEQAVTSSAKAGEDASAIKTVLLDAEKLYAAGTGSEPEYCGAIRALRGAIRKQKELPEAGKPYLNRFPTDPLF